MNVKFLEMNISIFAFCASYPTDGLPCLADWMTHAVSIWITGFESWREAIEIKPLPIAEAKKPLVFGSLEAAKGKGRMSIILFTIVYSYLKLKNNLSDPELQDFGKFLGTLYYFWDFHIKGSPLENPKSPNVKGDAGGENVAFHVLGYPYLLKGNGILAPNKKLEVMFSTKTSPFM